jgi:hypothetical protein
MKGCFDGQGNNLGSVIFCQQKCKQRKQFEIEFESQNEKVCNLQVLLRAEHLHQIVGPSRHLQK